MPLAVAVVHHCVATGRSEPEPEFYLVGECVSPYNFDAPKKSQPRWVGLDSLSIPLLLREAPYQMRRKGCTTKMWVRGSVPLSLSKRIVILKEVGV